MKGDKNDGKVNSGEHIVAGKRALERKAELKEKLATTVARRLELLTGVSSRARIDEDLGEGVGHQAMVVTVSRWRFTQLGMRVLGGLQLQRSRGDKASARSEQERF